MILSKGESADESTGIEPWAVARDCATHDMKPWTWRS